MKPACVKCQCFYRPKKNGFTFIEGMPITADAKRGTAEPENWKPYKLWRGDLWECPECGHEIISGVAASPMREHYQPDFAEVAKTFGAELQINDC